MRALFWTALMCASATVGCRLPGRPPDGPEVPRPEQVLSFPQLYAENCAGCHGVNGDRGPATDLANPEYQALIDDTSLRGVIAGGEKGTLMPGFSLRAGGNLTDAQVDALVRGVRSAWQKPGKVKDAAAPAWQAQNSGDPTKGETVYMAACARCHGNTAQQPGPAGTILDGSFLALINEQTLRTTIIAGRPDVGQPDWRNLIPGRALTEEEVDNVTAWLVAQTPPYPGHPYPDTTPTSERPGEQQPIAVRK